MNYIVWLLKWILKAAIFFTLFAFALNNQHEVVLHFFFGTAWRAPLVLVVLVVLMAGVAIGVLGMVPRWWRHRRAAQAASLLADAATHPAGKPQDSLETSPLRPHGL